MVAVEEDSRPLPLAWPEFDMEEDAVEAKENESLLSRLLPPALLPRLLASAVPKEEGIEFVIKDNGGGVSGGGLDGDRDREGDGRGDGARGA